MRKTTIVEDRQTLFDLAIQKYGSIEGAVQLLTDNPTKIASVTSTPTPTTLLKLNGTTINQDVLNYYVKNNLKPVSLQTGGEDDPGDYNIDYNNDYYN